MEWDDLEPVVKTVPWAKASITVNADGKPRMQLTFSEPFLQDCGHPKKANVQTGVKDGKALVRLVWAPDGKFEIKEMEKGGGRIHAIPVKEPIPDGARDLEPCELVSKGKDEAIFVLPLEAWEKQLNQPAPQPVRKAEPPKSIAQDVPKAHASKINAAEYLKAKGVRCAKLAGDWWMLDNEKVPRLDVLARVNELRRRADLPALGIDNIE